MLRLWHCAGTLPFILSQHDTQAAAAPVYASTLQWSNRAVGLRRKSERILPLHLCDAIRWFRVSLVTPVGQLILGP